MKKVYVLLFALIIATACSEDETITDQEVSDVLVSDQPFTEMHLESNIEITEVVEFNGNYIFGGFDGFMVTDQNLNILQSYEEDMSLNKIIPYGNHFACVCTHEGIFKINSSLEIEKIIDLPCTDMDVDKEGEIVFVSGVGMLSDERQISANILVLDVEQKTFSYYSDPMDSVGVFLAQIEILENGEIFTLSQEASVFRYENKAAVEKYSMENVDFFPDHNNVAGLSPEYMLKAIGHQLYFTIAKLPRALLKYDDGWEQIAEGDKYSSEKEILFSGGAFFELGEIDGQCVIGTQNGLVRIKGKDEFDLVKHQNLSNQLIRKIYTNSAGKLMFILPTNIVAIAE
jgi:hypothetical protein